MNYFQMCSTTQGIFLDGKTLKHEWYAATKAYKLAVFEVLRDILRIGCILYTKGSVEKGDKCFLPTLKVKGQPYGHVFSESRLDLNSPSFQLLKFNLNVLLHCENTKLNLLRIECSDSMIHRNEGEDSDTASALV